MSKAERSQREVGKPPAQETGASTGMALPNRLSRAERRALKFGHTLRPHHGESTAVMRVQRLVE